MKLLLIILSTFILKSCGSYNTSKIQHKDSVILTKLNNIYEISTLNNKDITSYKLIIEFDDKTKKINGFSGCNHFFGSYELKNHALKIKNIGATRMMCQGDTNTIEKQFYQALNKINNIKNNKDSIALLSTNNVLIKATKKTVDTALIFEYTTSTRGIYQSIKIDSSSIHIKNKQSAKPVTTKLKSANWQNLLTLAATINIEALSHLKAPSKNHQFDGAALAQFKITKGNKTYEVDPFDHGKPNAQIETLVKEILSIAKNIE